MESCSSTTRRSEGSARSTAYGRVVREVTRSCTRLFPPQPAGAPWGTCSRARQGLVADPLHDSSPCPLPLPYRHEIELPHADSGGWARLPPHC
jgi:hypothetical protein